MNKKLQEILEKNAQWERETPYNYCDRWCERCTYDKQKRCSLYKDELERKITCIAHGRDENDTEITGAVLEAQYGQTDEILSEHIDKYGIDLDNPDIDEDDLTEEDAIDFDALPQEIQNHIKFVENNPLSTTVEQYCKRAHEFLKDTFYKDDKKYAAFNYDFETVGWYHTLLPLKLQRALAGFHEPVCDEEFALYDAVAQFEICKGAIKLSVEALHRIQTDLVDLRQQILELIAILHNIYSRIEMMEGSI